MRRWILLSAAAAAGCSAIGTGSRDSPRTNGAAYAATNRIIRLTPEQRSYVQCEDGQPLVCTLGSGRLSIAECQCPLRRTRGHD